MKDKKDNGKNSIYMDKTEQLITGLGGMENITSVTNCMTRVRVVVRSEEPVDEAALRALKDVMGIVHDRDRYYEIVVGPGKSRKYADQCHELGIPAAADDAGGGAGAGAGAGKKAGGSEPIKKSQKDGRVKKALKTLGDIFVPLIPGIITAGLCAGFAALIAQLIPNYDHIKTWNIIYNLLTLISTSFMTYLTAWAGYRAAERFGATPILGGMLGMITSLDGINTISKLLGLFDSQNELNSILRMGKGGVLAVIVGVYLLSIVEKKIRKRMPESIDVIFTPLLTLLICVVPYVLVIMPALGYVSSGIVWVFSQLCLSKSIIVRIIAGFVSAALFLPLVAAGMHHGLVALYSVQLQEIGYITLYPALAMAGAGQVGASIALWIKAKRVGNKELGSVIAGALPAGFLGIGEPLIYGVTLPLGKPFITAGIGAGFGGALVMAMEVGSTTWGPSGLLGVFVMTSGPLGAIKSVLVYVAGLVVSYIASFIITSLFYSEKELAEAAPEAALETALEADDASAPETALEADDAAAPEAELGRLAISAPCCGESVRMEDIPDPVFASGMMGECTGIMPENGKIYAPVDGVVSVVTETKHSIVFTAADGRNIMIHAGIDTVKLNGRGFSVFVKEGDKVSAGDHVMTMDIDVIREEGMSPIVVMAEIS